MTEEAKEKASAMRERLRAEGRREMYERMRPHLELLRRQNDATSATLWVLHTLDPDYVPQPVSAF